MKKGRLTRAGGLWPERFIFMIHNLQKLVHMQCRRIERVESQLHRTQTSPASHSRSRLTRAKRGGPSLTHRPHPTANFIRLRASAAVGPESREADGCPSFLEKRDRTKAELFHRKSSQCTQIFPSRTLRACSLPKQKTQRLCCHRGSTHNLKRLASARHDREKTVLLPECTLQTKQSVKRKKKMMYSPGGPYIMVMPVVTSWAVAGQRMVFLHMYLQTRVTLRAFPIATSRL